MDGCVCADAQFYFFPSGDAGFVRYVANDMNFKQSESQCISMDYKNMQREMEEGPGRIVVWTKFQVPSIKYGISLVRGYWMGK